MSSRGTHEQARHRPPPLRIRPPRARGLRRGRCGGPRADPGGRLQRGRKTGNGAPAEPDRSGAASQGRARGARGKRNHAVKRQRIGSIDETTAGHHRVRVRTPSGGRETLGTYPTREEAERMRDAAMSILVAETDLDGVRLGVYIDRWLTDRQLRKAVRDPRSERMWFERYVVGKPLASIAVRSVRRRHVKAWLRTTKLKGQSAKNALQVVRGALWAAVDEELVRGNPAADIRVPGVKRTETPWTFLSLEEQRRLAASVEGPEAELLRFAIWSGLRAGELCTLRLADVHLDGPNPHVVVRYGTAPALPTKTSTIR